MAELKGRMVVGGLWLGGARVAINSLGFISTFVLARLLAPADFGLVALGTSFMAIVTAMTEMSMAQALIHHRDAQEDHFHTAWTLNALRGIGLAILMCAAAGPIGWLYDEPRLEPIVYALSASVLLAGLQNPRQVALIKDMIFSQQFALTVSQNVATIGVSILVAFIYENYWALIAGALAGQTVHLILSYAMLPFIPRVRFNKFRDLWGFSAWMTLGNVVNTINTNSDQLLVGGILGRTTLGLYTVGGNLAQIPTRETVTPLRDTLFPALARIAHDPHRFRNAYQEAQTFITFLVLPIGVGFALVAEPVVLAVMGEKWLPAVPVIQALSSVFALQTMGAMVRPLAMAKGKTRELFYRDLFLAAVRIPVVIVATLTAGLGGLILSRVFTGLLGMVINFRMIRQIADLSIVAQIVVNWRTLCAAALMALAVWWTNAAFPVDNPAAIRAIAQPVVVGAVVYIGAVLTLWLLVKRPRGPEAEVLGFALAALDRIGARRRRIAGHSE